MGSWRIAQEAQFSAMTQRGLGGEDGRKVQEGGNTCTRIVDSLCSAAETNTL